MSFLSICHSAVCLPGMYHDGPQNLIFMAVSGRLERIEAELGALSVQSFCMFIVLATHGLTRLELFDLLSNKLDLVSRLGASTCFPPLLLDQIIESLGRSLSRLFKPLLVPNWNFSLRQLPREDVPRPEDRLPTQPLLSGGHLQSQVK